MSLSGSRCKFFLSTLVLGWIAIGRGAGSVETKELVVTDLGLASGFQDSWGNHYKRGRAIVAEDFDGDGRVDFFIGNPGDESFIFRNEGPGEDGVVRFSPAQVLLEGELAFVAGAADYDGDGDFDLFVGCGGLEGSCLDYLFRNDSTPGHIHFVDVTQQAGLYGPASDNDPATPLDHATAGVAWGDYDRDGDPDLFISVRDISWDSLSYRSVLWRNNGDGTFADVTLAVGLGYWAYNSGSGPRIKDWGYFQNSSWIDVDNDGDLDLLLNDTRGPNVLWKNLLVEERRPRFVDATQEFSLPGESLRFPFTSFSSAVADVNNDGWQDLILFSNGTEPRSSPYGNGNGLFLNHHGEGFYNVSKMAGIDRPDGMAEMAMGSQVADLNADGIPDLIMGGGGPLAGSGSKLFLSRGLVAGIPTYEERSDLINFEPAHGIDPSQPPFPRIPPFPYRTHGMAAADVDGDGHLELAVVNGGTAVAPPIVREPNRLFKFGGTELGNTFRLRLTGNGTSDSHDAIGARAYVEIPTHPGKRRVYQTVLGNSGFSAESESTLTFGLGPDRDVSRVAILWPSGCLQVLETPDASYSPLHVKESCWSCASAPGPVKGWLDPDAYGCSHPPAMRVKGAVVDSSGPVPWTRVLELHAGSDSPVAEARTDLQGSVALEHPSEPGLCQTIVVEPFGYLPASNPVMTGEMVPGEEAFALTLVRGAEALWPRPSPYWTSRARSLATGKGNPRDLEEMDAWMHSIRERYPGLREFLSPDSLSEILSGRSTQNPIDRLRRHLAGILLNLASGRLSSFTRLASGERLGDLVEGAYTRVLNSGGDPAETMKLADRLEAVNEGRLLP